MRSAGFVDPCGGKQLSPFPLSFLQEELSELGHILGTDVEPPSAAVDALRTFIPSHRVDAERIEETRAEVIDRFLVCNFLHDGCKYICGQTVVNEYLARRMRERSGQKFGNPVFVVMLTDVGCRIGIVSARHGEQVAYFHLLQLFVYVCR